MKTIKKHLGSPWFAISLGIVGLVIGYTVMLSERGDAFAADAFCPAHCTGTDCPHQAQ